MKPGPKKGALQLQQVLLALGVDVVPRGAVLQRLVVARDEHLVVLGLRLRLLLLLLLWHERKAEGPAAAGLLLLLWLPKEPSATLH